MSSGEVDLKDVQRQLSKVVDPEIGVPIVEMNLVDKLDINGGNVDIQYHATTPYCPPVFALKISQDGPITLFGRRANGQVEQLISIA